MNTGPFSAITHMTGAGGKTWKLHKVKCIFFFKTVICCFKIVLVFPDNIGTSYPKQVVLRTCPDLY